MSTKTNTSWREGVRQAVNYFIGWTASRGYMAAVIGNYTFIVNTFKNNMDKAYPNF